MWHSGMHHVGGNDKDLGRPVVGKGKGQAGVKAGFGLFRALEATCGCCESRIWADSCFDKHLGRLVVVKGKGPSGCEGRIWGGFVLWETPVVGVRAGFGVVSCFGRHLWLV